MCLLPVSLRDEKEDAGSSGTSDSVTWHHGHFHDLLCGHFLPGGKGSSLHLAEMSPVYLGCKDSVLLQERTMSPRGSHTRARTHVPTLQPSLRLVTEEPQAFPHAATAGGTRRTQC